MTQCIYKGSKKLKLKIGIILQLFERRCNYKFPMALYGEFSVHIKLEMKLNRHFELAIIFFFVKQMLANFQINTKRFDI